MDLGFQVLLEDPLDLVILCRRVLRTAPQSVSRHAYWSSSRLSEREKRQPGGENSRRDENKQDWNNDQPAMRLKLTLIEKF